MSPLWLVFIGLAVILVCILYFKLHAFVSLMLAALVTGLLTTSTQLAGFAQHSGLSVDAAKALMSKSLATRLITAFGDSVGKIGILIAFASLIGTALHRSGAAEKIVRTILKLVGSKHTDIALITSSFTLGIPVFFDTVFYLLIPIVKSAGIRNPSKFSLYLMCSIAGGVMTHSLVPPTPGPLFVAKALNVDIGVMIMAGIIIGAITVCAGYAYARWANKKWELPMRSTPDVSVEELQNNTTLDSKELPSAFFSFLPVILPILLISLNTSLGAAESNNNSGWLAMLSFIGDSNMALIISALLSLILLRSKVKDGKKFEQYISESISSAAMIILITGAGGAFGQMLQQTDVGGVIGSYAATYKAAILPLAFLITLLVRTAQGSATVAMITAIGVMNGLGDTAQLGFHPVYLAIAIGCGSKIFPWMNDSAFWIITRMSGMETKESIKFFSYLLTIMGFTGLIVVMLAAKFFPLV